MIVIGNTISKGSASSQTKYRAITNEATRVVTACAIIPILDPVACNTSKMKLKSINKFIYNLGKFYTFQFLTFRVFASIRNVDIFIQNFQEATLRSMHYLRLISVLYEEYRDWQIVLSTVLTPLTKDASLANREIKNPTPFISSSKKAISCFTMAAKDWCRNLVVSLSPARLNINCWSRLPRDAPNPTSMIKPAYVATRLFCTSGSHSERAWRKIFTKHEFFSLGLVWRFWNLNNV